jgi:hypothetical protein
MDIAVITIAALVISVVSMSIGFRIGSAKGYKRAEPMTMDGVISRINAAGIGADEASWNADIRMLPIVAFATGNLDPATVRDWPYATLRAYATGLRTHALNKLKKNAGDDVAQQIADQCGELIKFADEAQGYEEARGPKKVGLHGQPFAKISDFGPQTPEAQLVHNNHVGIKTDPVPEATPNEIVSGEITTKKGT